MPKCPGKFRTMHKMKGRSCSIYLIIKLSHEIRLVIESVLSRKKKAICKFLMVFLS